MCYYVGQSRGRGVQRGVSRLIVITVGVLPPSYGHLIYVFVSSCHFFCFQVTTLDGIQSRRADLKVVTPEAFILADEEYHIDRGSSLNLVCIIEKATAPPQ